MTLDFDNPFDARGACRPADTSWSQWLESLPRQPELVVLWSGPAVHDCAASGWRIGGYFVEPIESVLGLRPFDDVIEGCLEIEGASRPAPYALFEFEKIVRMMLHDSGLAFEMLASPARLFASDDVEEDGEPHAIARAAISRGILGHYRESTRRGVDDLRAGRDLPVEPLLGLFRELATGAALHDGRASLDVGRLAEHHGCQAVVERARQAGEEAAETSRDLAEVCLRLAEALEEDEPSALPSQPEGYDSLDTRLVERRLSRV